ncbi:hypothetical protein [Aquipseudomonas ullengensis]|uniref:Uncharacterized protein n=1 Tax=Aquipseudomonas ullengensis TaxID=2759166 RepID=A0A7W4LMQ9_9GAMM|nr:hypothetical protein [Pseudomonas ullengensis]MBB2495973.1 hypothetical protein [Pseudomonas ullengensis]
MTDSTRLDTREPEAAEQAYPRDFDIRARYAEQQELLSPHSEAEQGETPATSRAH